MHTVSGCRVDDAASSWPSRASNTPRSASGPGLSIVIPVFNEAGSILPLLAEIVASVGSTDPTALLETARLPDPAQPSDSAQTSESAQTSDSAQPGDSAQPADILAAKASLPQEVEILVVDDGSTDSTSTEVRSAMRLLPNLRLIEHRERSGQSAAIVTGVRAARAFWVATLDGDGQNDPSDIARLWRLREDDPEVAMVCGIRTKRRDSASKRWASRIANSVRGRLLGDGVVDTGCGLKLFQRQVFLDLPSFDHMHRFLPALVQSRGHRVETVEVGHRCRRSGRSKYGVLDRLRAGLLDLAGVWWLVHRRLGKPNLASEVGVEIGTGLPPR